MPNFKKTVKQLEATALMGMATILRVLLFGGSRSGKSFIIVRQLIIRAIKSAGSRHLILRFRFNHIKTSIWEDTLPKVIDVCFPEIKPVVKWNNSDYFIEFPNKSQIWIGGLDDKDRSDKILGNEYASIYFNEISQISYKSVLIALTRLAQKCEGLINRAYFDCNPPTKKHWSYKVWFEHKDPISNDVIKKPEMYAYLKLQPDDNRENISDDYIENTLDTMTGASKKRFRDGDYSEEGEGALWDIDQIDRFRVTKHPTLQRVVITIDPAVTSNEDSDETGIIPVAKGVDGHYYVLDDLSGIYTPNGWALKAVNAYHDLKADRVIGEANNGGDMIEAVIRNIDKTISYKKVTATRGKALRAEPIVSLYEQGLVHHVGTIAGLEDQMVTWNPTAGDLSPGRIDALVWGLTELSQAKQYNPMKTNW